MTKLPLPNPSFFTLQELSQRWGCDLRLVENYVFDQRLLRPGFRVRDIGEHVDCRFFVSSIDRVRFGDTRFLVDDDPLPLDQWVYLWIKGPVPYDAYRVRGVDMVLCYDVGESDAPVNSYDCLELEFQDIEGNSLKLVPRGDAFIYGYETLNCEGDAIVLSPKHKAEVMIPRGEVERFEQSAILTVLTAKPDPTNKERDNLLAMIGMLAKQVMADHEKRCTKSGGTPNADGIARLLEMHLPLNTTGLSKTNLRSKLVDAFAIWDKRNG